MKYGLRIPSFALGPKTAGLQEMGSYLRRAEDLGFDSAVSIDHLLLTPPAYACTWLEPIAMLSALAGVTRTIRLGTMVLVLPLRNPVYFAKEWATLDLLSGGRSILGIGVGWHEEEFALMNVPYKERGPRMNEAIELVRALWAGDRVNYDGRFYKVRDLTIDPKPVQQPHPPIWIGGGTQPSEKVYGQPFASVLQTEIARPLGLTIARCAEPTARYATGYRLMPDGKLVEPPGMHHSQLLGAGGICATTGDLVRWTHALHHGRVLSPGSYAAMTTPKGVAAKSNYGLGQYVRPAPWGGMVVTHGGQSQTGHTSELQWYVDNRMAYAMLYNAGPRVLGISDLVPRVVLGVPLPSPGK